MNENSICGGSNSHELLVSLPMGLPWRYDTPTTARHASEVLENIFQD